MGEFFSIVLLFNLVVFCLFFVRNKRQKQDEAHYAQMMEKLRSIHKSQLKNKE